MSAQIEETRKASGVIAARVLGASLMLALLWTGAALAQTEGAEATTSHSATAVATEAEAARVATARALAIAGVQLAEADRCDEAILKLRQADELHPAPVVRYHLGACEIRLGRLIAGSEILRGMLREPPPVTSNSAVEDARRRATSLLDKVGHDVATLTVLLDAPPGSAPSVRLDGQPFPSLMLGVPRAIDPGEHTVEAHGNGLSSALQKLRIGPGQTRVVAISLKPGGAVDTRPTAPVDEVSARSEISHPSRPRGSGLSLRRVPAYIAWGIGASALFVGAGYGWAAMRGSAELDQLCPQRMCPPEAQARLASERTRATVATIAFTVAAAGGVAGTVLYLTSDDTSERRPTARAPRPPSARTSVGIGLHGLQVGLRFD